MDAVKEANWFRYWRDGTVITIPTVPNDSEIILPDRQSKMMPLTDVVVLSCKNLQATKKNRREDKEEGKKVAFRKHLRHNRPIEKKKLKKKSVLIGCVHSRYKTTKRSKNILSRRGNVKAETKKN